MPPGNRDFALPARLPKGHGGETISVPRVGEVELRIEPGFELRGLVRRGDELVKDGRVTIDWATHANVPEWTPIGRSIGAGQGEYRFEHLRPGVYTIQVEGYPSSSKTVEFRRGDPRVNKVDLVCQ